jgi:hypothetical protein
MLADEEDVHLLITFAMTLVTIGEIGVQDFLKAVGNGVESHADKVSQAIDSVSTLLQTRSGKLKGLGVPCKQVDPLSHLPLSFPFLG